ncbi:MAG TPA: hypothetical protein VFL83_05080 [Anaeromyxobacter sp.]|nr:hypothetical protein [Anaeromyxobacter sp.]
MRLAAIARRSILAVPLLLGACSTPLHARVPDAMGFSSPSAPNRCRVGAERSDPLVTEWPAPEKANLEALLRHGGVAVEYTGCAMRVLPRCGIAGRYAWQRTSPATDTFDIDGEDELWAKLPLGAASLEGELSRSGKLVVKTKVSGQLRLEAAGPIVPADEACARATHVVGALAIGAFSLEAGSSVTAKAGVELSVASAGGKRERSQGFVHASGDWEACASSTDEAPHPDCRSPIQAFLWPIAGRAAEEGPPGTVKVDLVAGDASQRWDVYYDDQVICSTPCTRWLDPAHPILLRARADGFLGSPRLHVRDLQDAADSGSAQVVASSMSKGKFVLGASIGGTGLMTLMLSGAIALADCGDPASDPFADPDGCSGAKSAAVIGALATAVGAWLVVDALPRAEVLPGGPAPRGPFGSLVVGPGFVAGKF